jgi:hypothetical protein
MNQFTVPEIFRRALVLARVDPSRRTTMRRAGAGTHDRGGGDPGCTPRLTERGLAQRGGIAASVAIVKRESERERA